MTFDYKVKNEFNQRYTKQLFYEVWVKMPQEQRVQKPPFTLYSDKAGYVNFGREYIELGDLTGYKIAMKYFEDYAHWTHLMKCPWFKEAKVVWDTEIEARLHSEGMDAIREIAKSDGAVAMQAAKFLATKGYKEKPTRGRPTKDQVQGALKQEVEDQRLIDEDFLRIVGK